MHIPDNYLSPSTCAVLGTAMVPAWGLSIKKLKEDFPREKIVTLGTCAAFSFLGMMFNIPIPGGTTGHAVGAVLIACMLGPWAACIAVSIALLVQCLLFGDGGLLAFGANCFNMALVMPFVGYGIYNWIHKYIFKTTNTIATSKISSITASRNDLIAAGFASFIGLNAAALCAAIEFGIQPMLFTDSVGNALYCPYSLSISIPAMMIGHLTIFGLAELIYTVFILAFLKKTSPDSIVTEVSNHSDSNRLSGATWTYILIGALIILTPLGLLATGTAWGEWGADEIADVITNGSSLGYTPEKIANGFNLDTIMPDYTLNGLPEWMAYVLSAVIGVALVVILFKVIGTLCKKKEAIFND